MIEDVRLAVNGKVKVEHFGPSMVASFPIGMKFVNALKK